MKLTAQAVTLKREIDKREADLKAMKAELQKTLVLIPTAFEAEKVDRMTWDGATAAPRREVLASKSAETDMEPLCDALLEQGEGAMVKRSVHAQTLKKFVKEVDEALQDAGFEGTWEEAMEASLGSQLWAALNVFEQNKAQLTNVSKKAKK